MICGSQQDAAQANAVTRQRKVDDLATAVRQILAGADPARLYDVQLVAVVAFLEKFLATFDFDQLGLKLGQDGLFFARQINERFEFLTSALSDRGISQNLRR